MSRIPVRLLVLSLLIAVLDPVVGDRFLHAQTGEFFNAGLQGDLRLDPAIRPMDVSVAATAAGIAACAKKGTGQLRLAGESGCNPSEDPLTLRSDDLEPFEVSRVLSISQGGRFNGIFGGLLCPPGRPVVSGGFELLRHDLMVTTNFVGPAFGLPRVHFASVRTVDFALLPEGDAVRMFATCL
jgi:hypothetical protein